MASDGDVGANAEIEFEIPKSEQKIPDLVKIDGKGMYYWFLIHVFSKLYFVLTSFFIYYFKDGTLYLDGHLDRETMSAIAFEVVARDRAHVRGDLDENINESRY